MKSRINDNNILKKHFIKQKKKDKKTSNKDF